MKIARVIPLLTTGYPMKLSNNRPVSILPLFSKLFERLMYNRLISFVNKHEISYSLQFGFRHGYSTSLAMIYLVDEISQSLDNGDYLLGLYLDFTKALDTANNAILLQKLEHYGARGVTLNWFKSYLSGRTQFVDYQGVRSTTCCITCGVPKGSILGPLSFLLYINDLYHVSSILVGLLFADDFNMFMSGKNPDELIHTTNKEMKKIANWLEINKLTLNIGKTHYMLFRNSDKKAHLTQKLVIRGQEIEMVESTKFLVYLDSRLAWRNHIDYIKCKISRGTGIVCKARKYLNQSILISLYYVFMYPYLNYCVDVWGIHTNLTQILHWDCRKESCVLLLGLQNSRTLRYYLVNYIFWTWSKFTTVPCRCSCTDIVITCYRIPFVIFSNPILRFTRATHDNLAIIMYSCVPSFTRLIY